MSGRFMVTLDNRSFTRKPRGGEIGGITDRLKVAGPTEYDAAELAEHIRRGMTWCGGCYEPGEHYNEKGELIFGPFVSQQLFAVDLDNECKLLDEDGQPVKDEKGHAIKRPLSPDESGYIDVLHAFRRCIEHGIYPLMWYVTMSATIEPWWHKYRLVFDMGEPVTAEADSRAIAKYLLEVFPEADKKCKNPNRLYFGSNGEVHDLSTYDWTGGRQ